ncbi:MAG: hypothetical protein M1833_007404 [Piccolia ochrophora]|nr:MAG: hypothetical protein M1833_007404 [Piccolia ochrophora]
MSSNNSGSPSDDYFNDLNRVLPSHVRQQSSSPGKDYAHANVNGNGNGNDVAGDALPRPKRIACVVCRKRKLKCDGSKPSCGTCSRLGHDCAYDEVRRKSGPKRGYVKALEARLAQVETMLKTQDPEDKVPENTHSYPTGEQHPVLSQSAFDTSTDGLDFGISHTDVMPDMFTTPGRFDDASDATHLGTMPLGEGLDGSDPFSWEMIGLGINEPLPTQDVVDELYQIYFEKIHPSMPMIHRRRFLAAMNLAPHMRPPVCLRYAMWSLAASVSNKYANLQEHFYTRARKYIEIDEMRGHGEGTITIAHSQAWSLIANYEFKMMYFPKAWMSTGRAVRLAQMMGLHRLDGMGLDVKQCLPPPRDWTDREERRRTFWIAFCEDRYASIGTGWPMTIDEKDILTNLPASEEAFDKNKQQRTVGLKDALSSSGASSLSPFAGVVLMACLFGRNLIHLHRPEPDDCDDDHENGAFWKRHRTLENILYTTTVSLPAHLKLPAGVTDANIVFLNMNIHTSTICLHQAAIFKADKNRLPASMNPFISFCLYVAARVFVQYLKSRRDDDQVRGSLHFLLTAMQAIKRKNPLTESFLVQLDVDLEGAGMDDPRNEARAAFGLKKGVAEMHIPGSFRYDNAQSQPPSAPIYATDSNLNPSSNPDLNDAQFEPLPTWLRASQNNLTLPERAKLSPQLQDLTCGYGLGLQNRNNRPSATTAFTAVPPNSHTSPLNHNTATSNPSTGNDMDLTPDHSAGSTGSVGDMTHHPSPSTSNASKRTPSHSSYTHTPPHMDDPNATSAPHQHFFPSHAVMTPSSIATSGWQPSAGHAHAHAHSLNAQCKDPDAGDPAFVIPPGWELGGATTQEMFAPMVDMGWESADVVGH